MGKTCAICGKPSGMYPLCIACFKLRDAGEITKCETCGTWYRTEEGCPNCKSTSKRGQEPTEEKNSPTSDELTCIICGNPSNGKHLCLNCYHKYKKKTILIKVDKCQFPCNGPLDESYEGVYPCKDGHIVKSLSEQIIDNYLYQNSIFHGYEYPLDIGIDKDPIKPDFCLKNYLGEGKDVYLEFFGMDGDPEYDKKTAYKMAIYREMEITLICMYRTTDGNNLEWRLQQKLNKNNLTEGKIHYEKL